MEADFNRAASTALRCRSGNWTGKREIESYQQCFQAEVHRLVVV